MTAEDDILAAEYALGLLPPEEATAVESRLRIDGPLSLRVAWWRDQLGSLVDEVSVEPSSHVWPAIAVRLGANDNTDGSARPWKWATAGMGAVAAALLAVIALRPDAAPLPVPVSQPAAPMVASLAGERGMAVTVAFDATSHRMLVTPVALDPGKGDAELWVIPVGATVPVSLGVIDARHPASHRMDDKRSQLLLPGATFAISQEAKGGSPTGAPQGTVVASGKIIRV
ncbi:MAG: anti-sigma factor [Sphingomonadales bacterium]